jgi:hypothetical protein
MLASASGKTPFQVFSFASAGGDIGGSSTFFLTFRGATGLFKDRKLRPLAAMRNLNLLRREPVGMKLRLTSIICTRLDPEWSGRDKRFCYAIVDWGSHGWQQVQLNRDDNCP